MFGGRGCGSKVSAWRRVAGREEGRQEGRKEGMQAAGRVGARKGRPRHGVWGKIM
jgi:hypothetical protein